MVTPEQALEKYGAPEKQKAMVLWDVPAELEIGVIPKRLYCNKDMVVPLTAVFKQLISTGAVKHLKTFDGCFNIRYQRGSRTKASLHSWGIAIDFNAFENQLNMVPKIHSSVVKIFKENGFDWGGDFTRQDGMHFQLKCI